jgi:hypothetical protein
MKCSANFLWPSLRSGRLQTPMGRSSLNSLIFAAGDAELSSAMAATGYNTKSFDIRYASPDPALQDLLRASGLRYAILSVLTTQEGADLWAGIVCSSWVWIGSGTTKRTRAEPGIWGDERVPSVVAGNRLAIRVAAMCLLTSLTGGKWCVEQPISSVLWHFPPFERLAVAVRPSKTVTHLGAFGAPSCKTVKLVHTAQWPTRLVRVKPSGQFQKLVKRNEHGRVTGIKKALKDSQSYPPGFGAAAAAAKAELTQVQCQGSTRALASEVETLTRVPIHVPRATFSDGHHTGTAAEAMAAEFGDAWTPTTPIRDEQVVAVLKAWPFIRNCHRAGLMPDAPVLSCVVGYVRGSITQRADRCPAVVRLLNLWLRTRLNKPGLCGFRWTTLAMNKNLACVWHRDSNNSGPSVVAAFGDYQGGGKLVYCAQDNRRATRPHFAQALEMQAMDPRSHLVLFDGRRGHSVTAFTGERYSVVFFCTKDSCLMSAEVRDELTNGLLMMPPEGPAPPDHEIVTGAWPRVAARLCGAPYYPVRAA